MPSLRHGVDRIADQVGEKLAQLAGKTVKIDIRPAACEKPRICSDVQPPRIERQNGIQQLSDIGHHWQGRLAVKAQGLLRHLGDAGDFLLRQVGIGNGLLIERWLVPQQVEKIGDRLQGIIDFVGDGSRQTAGGGQFFRFPQRLLGALALGCLDHDRSHPSNRLRRSL